MRNPFPLAFALALVSTGLQLAALFPEETPNYWQMLLLIGVVGQLLAVLVILSARRTHRLFAAAVQTDPLTQIGNRRRLERSLRPGRVVLFIDLDHFGRINQSAGHQAGDRVLVACAAALSKLSPEGGSLCRYGGEEFAIIFPTGTLEAGGRVAEAIRTSFAEAKFGDEYDAPITLSAGVALQGEDETGEEVLGRADAALLAAKEAGRNCTFLHDGSGVKRADAKI